MSSGYATTAAGVVPSPLPDAIREALAIRGVSTATAMKYGLAASRNHGGVNSANCLWISFPHFREGACVHRTYRTIGGGKHFSQDPNSIRLLWNEDCLRDSSLDDQPVIITEGHLDALSAIEAGYPRTLSVPDGAPSPGTRDGQKKYEYMTAVLPLLRDCRNIVLATDGDPSGLQLLHDLSLRLGRARCRYIDYSRWPACKDLNDILVKHGKEGVRTAIGEAPLMRIDGVYRMSDLPPLPAVRRYGNGIPLVERHYQVRPGDLTIITGLPGSGKSTFLNHLCGNMALLHNFTTAFASFEQLPQHDHRRALRSFHARKPVLAMTPEEIQSADNWIDNYFVFIVPDSNETQYQEPDLLWLLDKCAAAVIRFNANMIIVDPWNRLSHNPPSDMNMSTYIGMALREIKSFAMRYQVHFIVAAHPSKGVIMRDGGGQMRRPDLAGIAESAHFWNAALS